MSENYDVVIIGAGIVGLSVAKEISQRYPDLSICLLEKEASLGLHASGRNSGILHSGIYYAKDSLKALFCASGAKELLTYCLEAKIPVQKTGKILLPIQAKDEATLQLLYERAQHNGATVSLIDENELRTIEPSAKPCLQALFTPNTAVVDPRAILHHISDQLIANNVTIHFGQAVLTIEDQKHQIKTKTEVINYGYVFNCTGMNADRIAKKAGLGFEYAILPFKGSYYKLVGDLNINHQLYPVPNLEMPFLGIHLTKTIHNELFLGPTAIPVLGRYHYHGLSGINIPEAPLIAGRLLKLYWHNKQNFRQLVHQQAFNNTKKEFLRAARYLVPAISEKHLQKCSKVGIRPQLINTDTGELVHDFKVLTGENSLHVLNAISPAFTCAFPFARYLVGMMMH